MSRKYYFINTPHFKKEKPFFVWMNDDIGDGPAPEYILLESYHVTKKKTGQWFDNEDETTIYRHDVCPSWLLNKLNIPEFNAIQKVIK